MVTYRFTAKERGMFVRSDVDVGWQEHLNCSGKMGWECYVPYVDGKATVYFGQPHDFTIVGSSEPKQVDSLDNKTAYCWYENATLVVQLVKQPAMIFDVADVRRN